MTYVAPSTVVAGQTYGAAAHNVIVNDVINHESRIVTATNQSVQVFTNEAARDAAITAPSEGMIAYLTAPTVPAATGGVTYVPSGVQTIYNGSVWVCVTPVGAFTSNAGSTTSASYTATLSGSPGTNPSVTLVTGTIALVSLACEFWNTSNSSESFMSVAVSGAGAVAASDTHRIGMAPNASGASFVVQGGGTYLISGLTAGTNTFALNYKNSVGTANFRQRRITVVGQA